MSAIHQTYEEFIWFESVCIFHAFTGEPDEDIQFDAFCTYRGGLQCLDEMQRSTNALLNSIFYVASYATTSQVADGPGDFDFDLEISKLYVPEPRPRISLLYATDAMLALTPWNRVQCNQLCYDPTRTIREKLILQRDLLLAHGVPRTYLPEHDHSLLRPAGAVADWFMQQTEPVRFPRSDLDLLIECHLTRGQLLNS